MFNLLQIGIHPILPGQFDHGGNTESNLVIGAEGVGAFHVVPVLQAEFPRAAADDCGLGHTYGQGKGPLIVTAVLGQGRALSTS